MAKDTGKRKAGPRPAAVQTFLVEELAAEAQLKHWELAGLRQCFGWFEGKQVTGAEFNTALEKFRNRPQCGGRLIL